MAAAYAPLTPADCDLSGLDALPLDVARLLASGLTSGETAEAFRAAVLLWCASWHQVPAASIPDDDEWCMGVCRRSSREWTRMRAGALRGFVPCTDGRLYHPVVAQLALVAWIERLRSRRRGWAGNAKRWNAAFDAADVDGKMVLARSMLGDVGALIRALRGTPVVIVGGSSEDRRRIVGGSSEDRRRIAEGSSEDRRRIVGRSPRDVLPGPTSTVAEATSSAASLSLARDTGEIQIPDTNAGSGSFTLAAPESPQRNKTVTLADHEEVAEKKGEDADTETAISDGELSDRPTLMLDGDDTATTAKKLNGHGAIPQCDHVGVLALWRELCPAQPQPRTWTETRRKHLQARWRQLFAEGRVHTHAEALAWFANFFRYVGGSDFLTGRAPTRNNRSPFFAELPWLMQSEQFTACCEGRYHPPV